MSTPSDLECDTGGRRSELLARVSDGGPITGIDYLEVDPADQRRLAVHFLGDVPTLAGRPDWIRITGGRRTAVRVIGAEVQTTSNGRPYLAVEVDQPGDFSDYFLEIERNSDIEPPVDEQFRRCRLNFKVACPTKFDCAPPKAPPRRADDGIHVDYLAKDYASFRRALLDLLPHLAPQWTERLAADLGITVLELLAYTGDQLSYYQDAVANEAFLETARQRISVRRHARLVDYHMHDGSSARTFVHVRLRTGSSLTLDVDKDPADPPLELLTRITEPLDASSPGPVIAPGNRSQAVALAEAVFRTSTGGRLDARLNRVRLHDWGNDRCCVPAGARTADLLGDLSDVLDDGDFLLLEEVKDPHTGDPTLADRAKRQVVRLTGVETVPDDLLGEPVTRVAWADADALTFTLWVTGSSDGDTRIEEIGVARGNLLLADHGLAVTERGLAADPIASGTRAPRFHLAHGPLGFRHPRPRPEQPAVELFAADPALAQPQVTRVVVTGTVPPDDWRPLPSLVGAGRFDHVFALETGNAGEAHLRFGDGVFGMRPPPDAGYDIDYCIGIGPEGHIGADALSHVITSGEAITGVRNPLPAWGGTDPESVTRVKQIAPAAFRSRQHRAVTEADYAEVTRRHPQVRNAVARFRWTGSWHTVFIAIDPAGGEDAAVLAPSVGEHVRAFALAGYDVRIVAPRFVPLDIELEICVDPSHFHAHVHDAVRDALTNRLQRSGAPGFFHPDRFTFGQPLHLSTLYAAVAAVEGVESVTATRFTRLGADEVEGEQRTGANLERGVIRPGALQILRLDDDPDFPENGLLALVLQGGKR